MNQAGIVEIDLHGMNKYQAKLYIDSQLKKQRAASTGSASSMVITEALN